ncbi:MAG: hypothetical protein QOD69_1634 [Solirubrobacteraceae bacterium]|nr:hypothetical protein [Solirubrobacteraceae bacterium]
MHPAQHRGLRELYVMARQLRDHWRGLAGRLQPSAPDQAALLREGSDLARALLGELTEVTAARGLHGRPAAQGFGARLASLHGALLDTSLEVNQALRIAVLDVVHVVTLLEYLAALARADADTELAAFLGGWAPRMRAQEEGVRASAVALGDLPDVSIRAAAPGIAGRVAHGAANAIGSLGEWVDARAAR